MKILILIILLLGMLLSSFSEQPFENLASTNYVFFVRDRQVKGIIISKLSGIEKLLDTDL